MVKVDKPSASKALLEAGQNKAGQVGVALIGNFSGLARGVVLFGLIQ